MARDQMRDSTKRRDREDLERSLRKFQKLKLEEENGDLTKAQNTLEILNLKRGENIQTISFIKA